MFLDTNHITTRWITFCEQYSHLLPRRNLCVQVPMSDIVVIHLLIYVYFREKEKCRSTSKEFGTRTPRPRRQSKKHSAYILDQDFSKKNISLCLH